MRPPHSPMVSVLAGRKTYGEGDRDADGSESDRSANKATNENSEDSDDSADSEDNDDSDFNDQYGEMYSPQRIRLIQTLVHSRCYC